MFGWALTAAHYSPWKCSAIFSRSWDDTCLYYSTSRPWPLFWLPKVSQDVKLVNGEMKKRKHPRCYWQLSLLLQDIPIGIKWPNDVYLHENRSPLSKLCGILVTTSITGIKVSASIGIGVNLNNPKPTMCLNQIIEDNADEQLRPGKISLEHFVATVLNRLEELVNLLAEGRLMDVLQLYQLHWLHAGALVTVQQQTGQFRARIVDIDEFGFLRVSKESSDGREELVTVHPDGNSFDMLNGLLLPKSTQWMTISLFHSVHSV